MFLEVLLLVIPSLGESNRQYSINYWYTVLHDDSKIFFFFLLEEGKPKNKVCPYIMSTSKNFKGIKLRVALKQVVGFLAMVWVVKDRRETGRGQT